MFLMREDSSETITIANVTIAWLTIMVDAQ